MSHSHTSRCPTSQATHRWMPCQAGCLAHRHSLQCVPPAVASTYMQLYSATNNKPAPCPCTQQRTSRPGDKTPGAENPLHATSYCPQRKRQALPNGSRCLLLSCCADLLSPLNDNDTRHGCRPPTDVSCSILALCTAACSLAAESSFLPACCHLLHPTSPSVRCRSRCCWRCCLLCWRLLLAAKGCVEHNTPEGHAPPRQLQDRVAPQHRARDTTTQGERLQQSGNPRQASEVEQRDPACPGCALVARSAAAAGRTPTSGWA